MLGCAVGACQTDGGDCRGRTAIRPKYSEVEKLSIDTVRAINAKNAQLEAECGVRPHPIPSLIGR